MRDAGWHDGPARVPASLASAIVREENTLAPAGAKQMRRAYGFDEVAIVPGDVTLNPELTDISFTVGNVKLSLPFIAASMDAIVDTRSAAVFSELGGLAVLNLEGIQARYDNPDSVLEEITTVDMDKVGTVLQKVYSQPIRAELVGERVSENQATGRPLRRLLHPHQCQEVRSSGRRGRCRCLCCPVHRHHRPPHLPQP